MPTQKKEKPVKKHGGGNFVFSTLSFIVICAALVFGMSVFFRVSNIEVNGANHYTASDIKDASGVKIGDNLMFINRQAISNRIYSKLLYIGSIKVSRKLPNTVVIDVDESGTVACISTDSGQWLIDKRCKLLEQYDSSGADTNTYISIAGLSGVKPVKGSIMSVSEEDKPKEVYLTDIFSAMTNTGVLSNVNLIDMSNVINAEFKYMGRFTVKLGKNENLEYKLELLSGVIGKLNTSDTGTIDLSQDKKAQFSPYE